ncbi:MAG: hypothetical protein ACLFU9_07960 [Candidatus Bathyarchaeia archaeon]
MDNKPWWRKLGIREKKDVAAFLVIFVGGIVAALFLALFGIWPFLLPYP